MSHGLSRLTRWTIAALTVSGGLGLGVLQGEAKAATSISLTLSPSSVVADGSSACSARVIVTDGAGHRLRGQRISFASSDRGDVIGRVIAHANGVYTATVRSSTTVGTARITATDSSSTPPLSAHATLTQTVGPAKVVAVSLSPVSIPADGSSTTNATATVTDAAGHRLPGQAVRFSSTDLGERIGRAVSHGAGTYSATITSSTTAGAPTVTATDTTVRPNVSGRATLTQTPNPSTTAMTTTPTSVVTNQTVTLIASVTSAAPRVAPAGAVAFEHAGVPIGGCSDVPVSASSQTAIVTCQTSFAAAASPEQLTAVFVPAAGSSVAGSRSAVDDLTVTRDSSSTSLDVSNPAVKVRSPATYTAIVAPAHPGTVLPAGAVAFFDHGTPIAGCAAVPLVAGAGSSTASCTVTYAKASKHLITAVYTGDPNFTGSGSAPAQLVKVLPLVSGTITAQLRWTFFYSPRYTEVLALTVRTPPVGSSIIVACHGRGCPYRKLTAFVARRKSCGKRTKHRCTPRTIEFGPRFARHHLAVGTRITVEIIRRNWIGKHYTFKMRAGQPPRIQIACLAPQSSLPGVGC